MEDDREYSPDSAALGPNEAHRRRVDFAEQGLQRIEEVIRDSREARYTDPEEKYWRYRAKPVWVSVVFGALAVLLITGQLWLGDLNAMLGGPLQYVGWWRVGVFFVGGYCAFIAWPHYVHVTDNRRNPPPRYKQAVSHGTGKARWRG
jgi:hypothetical protein